MRNLATKLGMHGTSVGGVTVYPVGPWLASQAHPALQAGLTRGIFPPG